MDASFDDHLTGFTEEQLDRVNRYRAAKAQSEQALREALAVDGLELLHGSDCRCAECCEKRKGMLGLPT